MFFSKSMQQRSKSFPWGLSLKQTLSKTKSARAVNQHQTNHMTRIFIVKSPFIRGFGPPKIDMPTQRLAAYVAL